MRRVGAALFSYGSAQRFPWFASDWWTLTVNPMACKEYTLKQGDVLDIVM